MTTPSQDRAAWLEERRKGIGGSDIAAIYSLEYSCRKHLWLDKRNVTPDFERTETKGMRLGKFMESYFADVYAEETGREVVMLNEPLCSAPPLRVNVDRLIWKPLPPIPQGAQGNFGVVKRGPLEIKCMGREMFYRTKREGLGRSYILQLQAGMIAANASWGSFAVGSRDSGDLIYFDVERDEALCNSIVADAEEFWRCVENGPIPDALEPDDRRCQKCEFRVTCQGDSLITIDVQEGDYERDDSLIPVIADYRECQGLVEKAEDLLGQRREELEALLGERQAVVAGDVKVLHRPQKGKTLYKGKELLNAYASLRATVVGEFRDLDPEHFHELEPGLIARGCPPPESFVSESKPSQSLRLMPVKGGQ